MHRILLLRHGKSSYKNKSLKDYDRPLGKRGKRNSRRIGQWMATENVTPDLIISSPAKRAVQTTNRVCKQLGIARSEVQWEKDVYNARATTVLQILSNVPEDIETVLVVGHHEALESIILRLSRWTEIPPYPKLIPTAALAWLEIKGKWAGIEDCKASLKSITRPRDLGRED
jgi:phosphohistidine phosphatase